MPEYWRLKAIKPGLLEVKGVPKAVYDEMRVESSKVQAEYLKTVATWKNKPKFKKEVKKTSGGGYMLRVYYDPETEAGKIYMYVDLGTSSHPIVARNAPMLIFRVDGYRPKTRPRRIASYKGARGKRIVSKRAVLHPGTEARLFTKTISERRMTKFNTVLARAIRDAIKLRKG